VTIKAIVFDFDGLIVDTETNEFKAFQDIFRRHGAELTLAEWSGCVGTDLSVYNPYDHLERCVGRPLDRDRIRELRKQLFNRLMENEQLRPGVTHVIGQARQLGLKVGIASSSSLEWVGGFLHRFGIAEYFDCIRTRDDVAKVKPDPELYLKAAECLGVHPREALAFEDSPNGALAARRAGLHCVVVPNSVTETLPFGEYSARISTMEGLDLKKLLASLESGEMM
jgi:HAD superfamily hydrolase (TIGR01509 family)